VLKAGVEAWNSYRTSCDVISFENPKTYEGKWKTTAMSHMLVYTKMMHVIYM